MSHTASAIFGRAARIAAVALVLLGVVILAGAAIGAPQPVGNASDKSTAVSLEQSATAVPITGTFGFSGMVDFPKDASEVRARLQVRLPAGKLVFQRTTYESTAEKGSHVYSFSRPLEGLELKTGSYPVLFSLTAYVGDSRVETQVASTLRVYDPKDPPVPVVVLAKVHARPLTDPKGRLAVDPASPAATRPRDQVDRIAAIVSADRLARATLALPPVAIEEWRRIASRGYTLASGTVVPQTDPTAIAYGATLTRLQEALATGRLELLTIGYSDPSLADLSANKLTADAAAQYDEGLSACFASLATTPSAGTAPAGGSVPRGMHAALLERGVTYAFVDTEFTRIGKKRVSAGAYPCADSTLTAIVVDARASRDLESGESSAVVAHTLDRLGTSTGDQPIAVRIDLDDSVTDATATVGVAMIALEATPWTQLLLGSQARPPRKTRKVTFAPTPTKHAPADFWIKVRSARAHATGLLAVLTASDNQAISAQTNSLLAESSEWSGPAGQWTRAGSGLEFADSALRAGKELFDAISISAPQMTLAGATGDVPVTIRNNSQKTLNVVVLATTGGGLRVVGDRLLPTKLPPRETLVLIPVDLQSALRGRLTVQVMADNVVVAKQSVNVDRSYLDRIALVGGVVLVLGGMLVWIVLRVRRSPDIDEEPTEAQPSDGTDVEPSPNPSAQAPLSDDDAREPEGYTEAHSAHDGDSDDA
jgi:hypothetical protein